jgi:hypothetical protein
MQYPKLKSKLHIFIIIVANLCNHLSFHVNYPLILLLKISKIVPSYTTTTKPFSPNYIGVG